jgi:hypothetical protein
MRAFHLASAAVLALFLWGGDGGHCGPTTESPRIESPRIGSRCSTQLRVGPASPVRINICIDFIFVPAYRVTAFQQFSLGRELPSFYAVINCRLSHSSPMYHLSETEDRPVDRLVSVGDGRGGEHSKCIVGFNLARGNM